MLSKVKVLALKLQHKFYAKMAINDINIEYNCLKNGHYAKAEYWSKRATVHLKKSRAIFSKLLELADLA